MNINHLVQQLQWTDRQTDRQHVLGGIVSMTGMLVASSVSQSVCLFVGVGKSSTSISKP